MAVQRILRGKPATLTLTYLDSDGAAAAPPGTTTVGVTREDGTVLVAAGTATTASGNLRTVDLTATQTARLDVLTATWTDGTWTETTRHEVVGGYLCTVEEIRNQRNLELNTAKFPNDLLIDARTWFEDLCARHVKGTSFVRRYQRDTFKGESTGTVLLSKMLPRSIIAVSESGTALTSTDWEDWQLDDSGKLTRNTDVFDPPTPTVAQRNISIAYEYGFDSPPADLKEAALVAIRSKVLSDRQGLPSREVSVMNEIGIVRLGQPGADTPTGIGFVDEVLNDYAGKYPEIVAG